MNGAFGGRSPLPMSSVASARIREAVDALPLKAGIRVLEIGCGPGVAAREIVRRWPDVYVLGIDRSPTAIAQAIAGSQQEIAAGQLLTKEARFHLAFALRVGALDGRHPTVGAIALPRIRAALVRGGRLFLDGGNPLREAALSAA
jgi:SAM-dependent methyltransferase